MERPDRRSIRLRNYDYATPGAYFVTVCVQERVPLMGRIVGDAMQLNDAGRMIEPWWKELTNKYPRVALDQAIVMPNHFHGIVWILGEEEHGTTAGQPRTAGPTDGGERPTLGDVMDWFKTMTTNAYIRGVKENGWPRFDGRLWQRDYYEHVVRDEEGLNRIREYVATNPLRWSLDRQNSDRTGEDEFDVWLDSLADTRPHQDNGRAAT